MGRKQRSKQFELSANKLYENLDNNNKNFVIYKFSTIRNNFEYKYKELFVDKSIKDKIKINSKNFFQFTKNRNKNESNNTLFICEIVQESFEILESDLKNLELEDDLFNYLMFVLLKFISIYLINLCLV